MRDISRLIEKLQKGDMSAFDEIYRETSRSIFFVAFSILKNKEESEDVVQETFIKLFKNYKNLCQNKNAFNWLYTVAKNLAINRVRSLKRIAALQFEETIVEERTDVFAKASYDNILDIALKVLDQEEFEILTMCLIKGFKRREVAELIEKPLPTVTWIYSKALKKLQEYLKGGEI